ncbi:hypothetical protein A3D77_04415 [Candidatus Gottesmanbacteria bacterium RIFCSPHIGHO2_02_FULL_39_11]|uniref:Glycosyltransferase 2-like domain-containing protein n=1 Tax=Candidatus Gottesmanbacteria bacterium RIFCSPHIGHO2_02_FULL_39_11 TaxID=1798382 RepID=A0A1F5ZKE2_9BACT|nr:MAG: hypothetical protein A3D77_04415 [Candidatus Gottesmanbacteria bacterium RIFCSPHIGHO2_02_FULL_39_11]
MIKNSVSVVITTKNEEKNIGRCLESIKNQTYPEQKIEIIVVDNNSTDKTVEIAKTYTDSVFNKGPERSAQRNFGIKKAKGNYVMFLDADMSLSPKLIEDCVERISDGIFAGLYIPEIMTGNSFWGKVRNFERSFYNGTVIDCVRFFPKKIWQELGGFDESLIAAEDWDLDRRLAAIGKTTVTASVLFHSERNFSFKKYLKKKAYYAQDILKYIKKWGRDDPIIRKQLGLKYRYFDVFTENGKWKKWIRYPHFMFAVFVLKFLVGANYSLIRIAGRLKNEEHRL